MEKTKSDNKKNKNIYDKWWCVFSKEGDISGTAIMYDGTNIEDILKTTFAWTDALDAKSADAVKSRREFIKEEVFSRKEILQTTEYVQGHPVKISKPSYSGEFRRLFIGDEKAGLFIDPGEYVFQMIRESSVLIGKMSAFGNLLSLNGKGIRVSFGKNPADHSISEAPFEKNGFDCSEFLSGEDHFKEDANTQKIFPESIKTIRFCVAERIHFLKNSGVDDSVRPLKGEMFHVDVLISNPKPTDEMERDLRRYVRGRNGHMNFDEKLISDFLSSRYGYKEGIDYSFSSPTQEDCVTLEIS